MEHWRSMWRVIGAVIGLSIAVLCLHVESLIMGYTEERGFKYRTYLMSYYIWLLGLKCEVIGQPIDEAALYVSNHRMMIDPVLILKNCKAYIVSKAEVSNYPILGNGAKNTGVIFVQRDHRGSRAAIRQKIEELLTDHKSVAIFPEGTVNLNPTTASFAKGSFDAAVKSGRPVVPVALDYEDTSVYWGTNISLIQHFRDVFKRKKIICTIHFLDPVTSDDAEVLSNLARESIDNALIEIRQKWQSHPETHPTPVSL